MAIRALAPHVARLTAGALVIGGAAAGVHPLAQASPPSTAESPSQQAARTGQPVEVPEHTTPTQRIVAQPDGTFSAELSAVPVRVRGTGGAWRGVDTSLVPGHDGALRPVAAPFDVAFSGGGEQSLVTVGGAEGLSLDWPGALPTPVVAGSTATYADVRDGVDVVVRAAATGLATYVVVKTPEAAADPAVQALVLRVERGSVRPGREGTLVALDTVGRPIAASTPARMWDSRGLSAAARRDGQALTANAGAQREASVRTEVTRGGDIRLVPDRALLRSPDAEFPLVIDPQLSSVRKERAAWAMVWSNGQDFYNASTEHARVGYDGWSSAPKKARSFFRFDIPSVLQATDTVIDSAQFTHWQVHSPNWTCNLSAFGPGVEIWRTQNFSTTPSWPGPDKINQLNNGVADRHAAGHETPCDPISQEWETTAGVKGAVNDGKDFVVFGLFSANEGDRDGWRKYDNNGTYPSLIVNYNRKPKIQEEPTVSGSSEANPSPGESVWTNDPTPSFTVNVDDGDDHALTVCFQVERTDGSDLGSKLCKSGIGTAASTWTTTSSIAAGNLNDGTYKVYATADDGLVASAVASPRRTFTVDTLGPPAITPTVTPPANGWVVDDAAGSITLDTTSDGKSFRYTLNGAAPTCVVGTLATADAAGAATVSVVASRPGENVLRAIACDRVGNPSAVLEVPFVAANYKQVHRWLWDGTETTPPGTDLQNPTDAGLVLVDAGTPVAGRTDGKNAVTAEPPGSDKALLLAGSGGQHAATQSPALTGLTKFTVSAWVRLDSAWAGGEAVVAAQTGAQTDAAELAVSGTSWVFRVRATDATNATAATASLSFDAAGCGPGAWCFVAGTWDGRAKTLRLRVYDRWVVSMASSPTVTATGIFAATAPFAVGAGVTGAGTRGAHLPGAVDAVRVFAGAPDDSEIDDIAAQTAG